MPSRPAPTPDPGLQTVQPTGWRQPSGYANGVRVPAGRELLFVAGQIAWDEGGRLVSDVFAAQFEQALRNCVTVVESAGGGARDIVRLTMYCRDRQAYLRELPEVGAAYRRVMGRHYPSMSLLEVSALLEDGAQIEIEATAALAPTGMTRSTAEAGG